MDCYEPGELLIVPVRGGVEEIFEMYAETFKEKLDVVYSVEDMLKYYHLFSKPIYKRFGAFPFVARVPEGEETAYAKRFQKNSKIHACIPNYYVQPHQTFPEINSENVERIISLLDCKADSTICGKDVKIAIIDTGVKPDILPHAQSLHPVQYSTDKKIDSSKGPVPFDPIGHGSTVAHIINTIAPSSEILSIKAMENIGNIGGLISAIYLAEAEFEPDIYNLSLSLSCEPENCAVCGAERAIAINEFQVQTLFDLILNRGKESIKKPLIVAAAGNRVKKVSMPACFPNVLGVGSFDIDKEDRATYSYYEEVPEKGFILAPGGLNDIYNCIARKGSGEWDRRGTFFGTSFSTAFVTAISARYLSDIKSSIIARANLDCRELLLLCLKGSARKGIANYSANTHGLGLACYNRSFVLKILEGLELLLLADIWDF